MSADPLASSSNSRVFEQFEKLVFMQRDVLSLFADNDKLFRKYSLLLLFEEDEVEELRGYILDEMLYRGLLCTKQKETKTNKHQQWHNVATSSHFV